MWERFSGRRTGSLWNCVERPAIYRERARGRARRLVDRLEWALDEPSVDADEKAAVESRGG